MKEPNWADMQDGLWIVRKSGEAFESAHESLLPQEVRETLHIEAQRLSLLYGDSPELREARLDLLGDVPDQREAPE